MNKDCTNCERNLPASSFYKDKRMKSGLSSECKDCKQTRSRKNWASYYELNSSHPEYNRWRNLKKRYNVSPELYDKMMKEQNGKCPICNRSDEQLLVDHCHETKVVRGLLCHRCNVGIGYFMDNIENLRGAIRYLNNFARFDDLS